MRIQWNTEKMQQQIPLWGNLQPHEEWHHGKHSPTNNEQETTHLARQQPGIWFSRQRIEKTRMGICAIGMQQKRWLGQKSHRYNPPCPTKAMNRDRIDGIVNFQSNEKLGSPQIQRSSDQASEKSGPKIQCCATGRNLEIRTQGQRGEMLARTHSLLHGG